MKHTPAPWLLNDLEANAKLITASSDLLAICKKMESFINNLPDGGDYELVEEAQEVIKKAEYLRR